MSTRCQACNTELDSPRDLSAWPVQPEPGELFTQPTEILVCDRCLMKFKDAADQAEADAKPCRWCPDNACAPKGARPAELAEDAADHAAAWEGKRDVSD